MLETELEYNNLESTYWTDSKVVLGYVRNEVKRFHTFVANRVRLIRENSNVDAWNYVETEMNPADDASRGLSCRNISRDHRWFRGPDFLWKTKDHKDQWPTCYQPAEQTIADDDPEVKKCVTVCRVKTAQCISDTDSAVNRLLKYQLSWYRLTKNVAWILAVKDRLLSKVRKTASQNHSNGLTVDEIHNAEIQILKYVQQRTFADETAAVKTGQTVKRTSGVYKLLPVQFDDGLLRVGGRMSRNEMPVPNKHPIIMPKGHCGTSLIVESYHYQSGHCGKELVLSSIREKYWIIGARRVIRQVLKKYIKCRKLYSRPVVQRMADLPMERITPDLSFFTSIGIDFFGPFLVKFGRNEVKRYGCIFTCLAVRAIHIEVVHSLEIDSFINTLQRFICRRGQPLSIRSDNGTNYLGAERELRETIKAWNKSQIPEFLRQKKIQWKFNPPTASHIGGVWERQIRTVRKILSALTNLQRLSDEALQTFLCIVENTVNSRPLTVVSDDPTDLEHLTLNHLLQLRHGQTVPPGQFIKQDSYCRRRWRQVQYLSDKFWQRWKREYLPLLQKRSKWVGKHRNLQVNDTVVIVHESLPRNCWLLGRVIKTLPGSDGLVRTVEVKTKNGVLLRPVHKVCIVESIDS